MDIDKIIEIIILVCAFLQIYIFLLYPMIIHVFAKIFNKKININENYSPNISIVIAAHNEEYYIKDAIDSIYNSDYPNEKISVYVGSDGSTDRTTEILEELKEQYGSIYIYKFDRAGKNAVLNNLVPETKSELILFLDADLRVSTDSIKTIVGKLSDPDVGAVLSSLKIITEDDSDNSGKTGETLYQKYESKVRINESKIKTTVNNLGTLYGIKREVYGPLPNDLICDDFYNLLHTIIKKKRVFFDPESVVYEVRKKSLSAELRRRVRLVGGGLSTLWLCKRLFNPKYGWASFFLFSHKFMRWMSPVLLILILAGTIILSRESYLWLPLVISQGALYLFALLGWIMEKMSLKAGILKLPLFFVSMNWGFLLGIFRFIGGGQNAQWERAGIE